MSSAAERFTPSRPASRALGIVGIALLARLAYLLAIHGTGCLDINLDPVSDMEAFHRWALSIVSGDWLGTGDFHPFHPWQAAIAAQTQWNSWYGHVFHQEPLYPYVIALIYLLAPRDPFSVILFQLVAGAFGCAFVYLAARRVVPEGAAILAGLMAAIYGPFLYYESLLLRDSLLIPLHAALLWSVLEAWTRTGRAARRWWLVSGLLTGISCITKASILVFVVLLAILILSRLPRELPRRPRGDALVLCLGFIVAITPVVARNLLVGAPAVMITTRGPIEFINGNNPWHRGTGWFDGDDRRVSGYAHDIMQASDGRLLPVIRAVLSSWSGDPAGLVTLQIRKLGYFLAPFEMPNNASYSYFREHSAQLRYASLSFLWVSPLALVGALVSWPRRQLLAPVYLFLLSGVVTTVAFYVIARFRAPLMAPILILAGLGLWSIMEAVRRRQAASAAGLLVVALAGLLINRASDYPDRALVRPQDYLIAIQGREAAADEVTALREANRAREVFPRIALFHRLAGLLELRAGHLPKARAALQTAISLDPGDETAKEALETLESGTVP